jgi:hypothetical protein
VTYDESKLIELACGDCILRIGTWMPFDVDPRGTVTIEIISNRGSSPLRQRAKNAWMALRGRYDWTGFEVYTSEEAAALVAALERASSLAFPANQE